MSRKVPEKGKPDFSNLGKDRLSAYRDMISNMIGAYSHDRDKSAVLKTVWKELNDEVQFRTSAVVSAPSSDSKRSAGAPSVLPRRKTRFRTSSQLDLTK